MAQVYVEFAGLVVAVLPPAKDLIDVLLLDARAAGGPQHSAVMLVRDVVGLKGSPDFTITRPSGDVTAQDEYAGWILRGSVEFAGNFAPFAAPDLAQTMDLKHIGAARRLLPANQRPVTASVRLTRGKLMSSGVSGLFDFHYNENDRVYGRCNEVELTDRVKCDLGNVDAPFQVSFQGLDGTRTVVTIPETVGEPILISNLASGSAQLTHHFGAYYMIADNLRQPSIRSYPERCAEVRIWDFPDNPDECRSGKYEE